MSGFSVFMILFGLCVFLIGLYMFTGHKVGLLEGRVAFQNLNKNEWKNIGKWTMIISTFIFALAILGFFFHWD